jgi:hypothetical protein
MNPSFYLIAESEFDLFSVECGIIPGCLLQEKLKHLPCFWLNSDCRAKFDGNFFFGDGYKSRCSGQLSEQDVVISEIVV